jgi:hypothetical protein
MCETDAGSSRKFVNSYQTIPCESQKTVKFMVAAMRTSDFHEFSSVASEINGQADRDRHCN